MLDLHSLSIGASLDIQDEANVEEAKVKIMEEVDHDNDDNELCSQSLSGLAADCQLEEAVENQRKGKELEDAREARPTATTDEAATDEAAIVEAEMFKTVTIASRKATIDVVSDLDDPVKEPSTKQMSRSANPTKSRMAIPAASAGGLRSLSSLRSL